MSLSRASFTEGGLESSTFFSSFDRACSITFEDLKVFFFYDILGFGFVGATDTVFLDFWEVFREGSCFAAFWVLSGLDWVETSWAEIETKLTLITDGVNFFAGARSGSNSMPINNSRWPKKDTIKNQKSVLVLSRVSAGAR